MGYSDDSKQSVFNAGVAFAERIDALQRAINAARFNPQSYNEETGTFNYQVIITSLHGLLMESWSKLDDEERIILVRYDNMINLMTELFPIVTSTKTENENNFFWNYENYKRLMVILNLHEKNIKDALDNHSLNSPNRDDDDEGL